MSVMASQITSLVMSYGETDLDHQKKLDAWRHQAITWTNVDIRQ